jgi:hypothetical protein
VTADAVAIGVSLGVAVGITVGLGWLEVRYRRERRLSRSPHPEDRAILRARAVLGG